MLHPSACALFGYPYTETNRFVKPIFDNALRTFLAFDIYRYRAPTSVCYLISLLFSRYVIVLHVRILRRGYFSR